MTSAREDDRQYFKKQTNYYNNYNNNYNRKNSFDYYNTTPSASGTITPYSTATIFTSNHNSIAEATGPGPALPSLKPTLEHSPVNNFNSQEVSDFLNNAWKEALNQYYDNNIPESEKPELHKSTWGARGGFVWGQRGNLMANGNDFFAELRKSSLSQILNGQQR